MRSRFLITVMLLAVISAAQKPPAKRTPGFRLEGGEPQQLGESLAEHKRVSRADREALLRALAPNFNDYPAPPSPMERAAQTLVNFVDLNADGVPEVIAKGSGDACSPTGNCSIYVLQKSGTTYRVILEKGAGKTVTVQKTRTNGYRDIVIGMHGSATEQGLFVYQFGDGRYRRTHCYNASFTYRDENGEIHELEKARITPCQK